MINGIGICNLGIENNLKLYGNECNVMPEILLSSYDIPPYHNQSFS